jgi:gliding motility-associated-like protein
LSYTQVELAFQGGESGDTWSFTSSGADATALAEAQIAANKFSGTQSLVVGGNTAGGSCIDGGSGNGPATPRTFLFDALDISSSNSYQRTLSFTWGNRYPVCVGTGWDSGEDLYFTPIHDGVAQTPILIVEGNANAPFSILDNEFTYFVPICVSSFAFEVSVTTNRRDELLFLDDVSLSSPALNDVSILPVVDALASGSTQLCENQLEIYSVSSTAGVSYTWSGLPASAFFVSENGTSNASSIGIDWASTPSGTYTITVVPSITSCSSEQDGTGFSFEVTISPTSTSNLQLELCEGEQIDFHGQLITSEGTYLATLSNSAGCDSVITATVTYVSAYSSSVSVSICEGESFIFNGVSYNASQTISVMLQSVQGCDSLVTVDLTVLPSDLQSIFVDVCEGEEYMFEGQVYTQSGVYNVVYASAAGCDSILQLTLTVHPIQQSNQTLTFCAGDTISLNGMPYSDPGTYVFTYPSSMGCDSVVTFTLVQTQASVLELDTVLCLGTSFQWNGQLVVQAGTYSYSTQASNSCDSLVLLHVAVAPSAQASFSYVINETVLGSYEVQFVNESTLASSYFWDFGDATYSTDFSPVHTFSSDTEFPIGVSLIAYSDSTCADSTFVNVNVATDDILYVPNTFTPDGNEFNQVFSPFLSGNVDFSNYALHIYNRWGNLIFVSKDVSIGWDGTSPDGSLSKTDTYTWKVVYKLADNDDMKVSQGHVQLLR